VPRPQWQKDFEIFQIMMFLAILSALELGLTYANKFPTEIILVTSVLFPEHVFDTNSYNAFWAYPVASLINSWMSFCAFTCTFSAAAALYAVNAVIFILHELR